VKVCIQSARRVPCSATASSDLLVGAFDQSQAE
jgi:hypothetical protein